METENSSLFLSYVPIFSMLSREVLDEIEKRGRRRTFAKDESIVLEEEKGNSFFIIIEGKVKVSQAGSDGREVVLTMLNDSDFFGEMSLIDGREISANITSMEESEIFILHRDDFLDLMKRHPEISIALLTELTHRLRTADTRIKSLSLKDAEGKIASVLIHLADESGKIKQGTVEIEKLPYQHDLANMAGTSRETVSRTLHMFAEKGLVTLSGSRLKILNYEKFKEEYAG